MNIGSDYNVTRKSGTFPSGGTANINNIPINTTDTLTKSVPADPSFKRPNFARGNEPQETAGGNETSPSSSTYNAVSPAMEAPGAVPGISSAVISTQLKNLADAGVKFLKVSDFFILSRNKEISPDEAASVLTKGDIAEIAKLRVETDKKMAPQPMVDSGDVAELAAFKGLGEMPKEKKEMADFLKAVTEKGWELRTEDGKKQGAYGAFNLLTTGWNVDGGEPRKVNITKSGFVLMTIDPAGGKDPAALTTEFGKLNESVKFLGDLDYSGYYLKQISKPYLDMTFGERVEFFRYLDLSAKKALEKYEIAKDICKDKNKLLEVGDVMKKQTGVHWGHDSEFDMDDFQFLLEKGKKNDVSPADKAETMRRIRKHFFNTDYRYDRRKVVRRACELSLYNSKDKNDFKRLSKHYENLLENLGLSDKSDNGDCYRRDLYAGIGFEYIIDVLKGNEEETSAFVDMVKEKYVGSPDEMKAVTQRFELVRKPVKDEDFSIRAKVGISLAGTEGFETNFKAVMENLKPGNASEDLVNLMKHIRAYSGSGDEDSRQVFEAIIKSTEEKGIPLADTNEILNLFDQKLLYGMDAYEQMATPVKDEGYRERKAILKELRDSYGTDTGYERYMGTHQNDDPYAIDDYMIIKSHMTDTETLRDAATRFMTIRKSQGDHFNRETAIYIYTILSEGMKRGKDIMADQGFIKALMSAGNMEEVKKILAESKEEAAKGPSAHKIVQEKDQVIIGGVRLERKKYNNLLRIRDKER